MTGSLQIEMGLDSCPLISIGETSGLLASLIVTGGADNSHLMNLSYVHLRGLPVTFIREDLQSVI